MRECEIVAPVTFLHHLLPLFFLFSIFFSLDAICTLRPDEL